MKYQCEAVEQGLQHVAYVRTRCDVKDLPTVLGESFCKIMKYLQRLSVTPNGAPYTAYFNMDMNDLDIEIGIPVSSEFTLGDDVLLGKLPQGKCAVTLHKGPYSDVGPAYNALSEWMNERGYVPQGVAYEFYLNDPDDTPPEMLETRIVFPLKEL